MLSNLTRESDFNTADLSENLICYPLIPVVVLTLPRKAAPKRRRKL